MAQVNPCPECYAVTLKQCSGEIQLIAGLTPLTDYLVLIETAFGKHYAVEYTSDADGSIVIDLSDYPNGLFNTQDNFTLTVVTELNSSAETLTICEIEYTCVQLSFANTTVTDEDFCEQIGCDT